MEIYRVSLPFQISTNFVYEEGILSLNIKNVSIEDSGNYSIRLETPLGSFDENFVTLTVNGKIFQSFIK